MSNLCLPSEPYTGDDALCGQCGKPIKLSRCEDLVDDVVDGLDGLPSPVLMAICNECAAYGPEEES